MCIADFWGGGMAINGGAEAPSSVQASDDGSKTEYILPGTNIFAHHMPIL